MANGYRRTSATASGPSIGRPSDDVGDGFEVGNPREKTSSSTTVKSSKDENGAVEHENPRRKRPTVNQNPAETKEKRNTASRRRSPNIKKTNKQKKTTKSFTEKRIEWKWRFDSSRVAFDFCFGIIFWGFLLCCASPDFRPSRKIKPKKKRSRSGEGEEEGRRRKTNEGRSEAKANENGRSGHLRLGPLHTHTHTHTHLHTRAPRPLARPNHRVRVCWQRVRPGTSSLFVSRFSTQLVPVDSYRVLPSFFLSCIVFYYLVWWFWPSFT